MRTWSSVPADHVFPFRQNEIGIADGESHTRSVRRHRGSPPQTKTITVRSLDHIVIRIVRLRRSSE